MIKTCECCKKKFETVIPNRKFCSSDCAKKVIAGKKADAKKTRKPELGANTHD